MIGVNKGTHAVCPYCLKQILPVGEDGEIHNYCNNCNLVLPFAHVRNFDHEEIVYVADVRSPAKRKR